jgi:DNA-binding transcriptional regulator YiaG
METKNIRLKALLTQEEFAEELSISVSAVRNWESGKFQPSLKQQRKILEFAKRNNIEIE